MRIVFDAFWWTEGPVSNRNVMQEIVRSWVANYPEDEIHVFGRRGTRAVLMEDLDLPAKQVHELVVEQHGLSILFEYPFLLHRLKVDRVFTHNFVPVIGVPSAVFVHDLIFATNPEWFTRLERAYFWLLRRSIRRAKLIFTSTETEAARIAKHVTSKPAIYSTGLAVSTDLARTTPQDPGNGLKEYSFSLIVGRLNERKNLGFGLRAMHAAGLVTPNNPVVVVGEKHGKNVVLDAEVLALVDSGAVVFVGFMSLEHLAWLYSKTSLLVFPTLDEGFGLPVVEGRYFGAPLALSDIGVLREVAGHSDAVFFPTGNLDEAGASIKEAVTRTDARRDRESRELLAQQYDWGKTVETIRDRMLHGTESNQWGESSHAR